MIRIILSIVLTSVFLPALSNDKDIAELEAMLTVVTDTARVSVLNELCIQYRYKDPARALRYGFEGLVITKDVGDVERSAELHNNIGLVYVIQSNYKKASKHYLESMQLFEHMENKKGQAKLIFDMAYMYKIFQEEYDTAITYYKRAYAMFRELDETKLIVNSLNALGIVYTEDGQFDLAEEYFMKMLTASVKYDLTNFEATTLKQLGWHYYQKKDFDQSLVWYRKAEEFEKDRNNLEGQASVWCNIAYIHKLKGRKSKAIDHFEQSVKVYKEVGNKFKLTQVLLGLTNAHLAFGNYNEAVRWAEYGLSVAKEMDHEHRIRHFYRFLHQSYDSLSQTSESLAYFKQYAAVNDSIRDKDRTEKIARIRASFDLDLKNKDITIKNAQIKYQRMQKYLLLVGLLALMLVAFFLIRKQRNRLKIKEINERLQKVELENLNLRKEDLEKELDFKKRELTAFTLNFVQKNSLIDEIKEELEKISSKLNGHKISQHFQRIQNKVSFSTNIDKDWKQFKLYFEQVHKGFFSYLKQAYPQLTANDLRLCALARLNMSSKEIATITGISPHSVKIARYRVRKKLNLKAEEDFNGFFLALENEHVV